MTPLRILIADPQFLTRRGLCALFASNPEFVVSGEAKNREELFALIRDQRSDVIVLDYRYSEHLSVDDIAHIKMVTPKLALLVITADDHKEKILNILNEGILNILTKDCSSEEIVSATLAASRGEKFFCNKVLDIILERHLAKKEEECAPSALSSRELEILTLVVRGFSSKDIAEKLFLSLHTVYTHRKNIMKKLGVKSGSELILFALQEGIVKSGAFSKKESA